MTSRLIGLWDRVRPRRLTKWARLWIVLCACGWLVSVTVFAIRAHSEWDQAQKSYVETLDVFREGFLATELAASGSGRLIEPVWNDESGRFEFVLNLSDGTGKSFPAWAYNEMQINLAMSHFDSQIRSKKDAKKHTEIIIMRDFEDHLILIAVNPTNMNSTAVSAESVLKQYARRIAGARDTRGWARSDALSTAAVAAVLAAIAALGLFFAAMVGRSVWRWVRQGA